VVSGEPEAVELAGKLAKAAGARGSMPLKVSGAFHSPLMHSAAERLRPLLEAAPIGDTRVPLVSNVDAQPRREAAALRAALQAQVTSSVRWTECVRRLLAEGADLFIEVGPGDVLTKLMKRIAPEAEALAASTPDGVAAVRDRLAG
jgi:[acyl-carrier-protein] S-malonyltransferase